MPIKVTCSCGRQFRVSDDHAGKRTICPACKQPLHVPGSAPSPSEPPPLPLDRGKENRPPARRMPSLKVWLAIAGAAAFVIVLIVVVAVVLVGGRSPSEALRQTFLYANEGKYSDANNGLSAHIKAIQDQSGMMKQLWDDVTRNGQIARVEILDEQSRGEGATVRYRIHYKNGRPYEGEEELIKEGGKWKFASLNCGHGRVAGEKGAPMPDNWDTGPGDNELPPREGPKTRS